MALLNLAKEGGPAAGGRSNKLVETIDAFLLIIIIFFLNIFLFPQ